MTRLEISEEAMGRVAACLRKQEPPPAREYVYSKAEPFFPPRDAAWAAPFFFTTVLHLYGLWEEDGEKFLGPIRGFVDGRAYDAEDFLWKAAWRSAQEEPKFLNAAFQASLTAEKWAYFFRDDGGRCPVPLLKSHGELARSFGEFLEAKSLSANKILRSCRESGRPAHKLAEILAEAPGYREDPLARKIFLLAHILRSRPERFLPPAAEEWPPVLDRHGLRLALRWGVLQTKDPELEKALDQGLTLSPSVEKEVREAAYKAFTGILDSAGRSVPETLGLFESARFYCPEDRTPDCAPCFFNEGCAKHIRRLPPSVRTLAY